jgi:hypothetical protein
MQEPRALLTDTTEKRAAVPVQSEHQRVCASMAAATAVMLLQARLYLSMTTGEYEVLMRLDCSTVRTRREARCPMLSAGGYFVLGCRVSLVRLARREVLMGRAPC